MTLYRLYAENGNRAGFWVQHRSWGNQCAQVQSIGGCRSGALPGRAPLHDSAEAAWLVFDVRSGRPIQLAVAPGQSTDKNYVQIAEPSWYDGPMEGVRSVSDQRSGEHDGALH